LISEADRLLAHGAPITLNGEPRRVRFGMASLRLLEKEYGGLDVFWAKLSESGFGASRIDTIFSGMVAGLLAIKPEDQDVEDFKRELESQLDPKDLLKYLEAVIIAFSESIPGFENDAPKGKGRRGNSHGRGSTTSPQSAMGAQTASSGG
jgi:hypothetical protein